MTQNPQQKPPGDGVIRDTLREILWLTGGGALLGGLALAIGGGIWFGLLGAAIGLAAGAVIGTIAGAAFWISVNGWPF